VTTGTKLHTPVFMVGSRPKSVLNSAQILAPPYMSCVCSDTKLLTTLHCFENPLSRRGERIIALRGSYDGYLDLNISFAFFQSFGVHFTLSASYQRRHLESYPSSNRGAPVSCLLITTTLSPFWRARPQTALRESSGLYEPDAA
jgi:hypothetical protein